MTSPTPLLPLRRRAVLALPAALTLSPAMLPAPLRAAPKEAARDAGRPRLLQLVDAAAMQQELVRDYTTGWRLAWATRGPAAPKGAGGPGPVLVTRPVDLQKPGALNEVVELLRQDPSIIGIAGSVGEGLAVQAIAATAAAKLRIAHIGPWMADARHDALDEVLSLFPSRAMQLRHAVAAVKGMGIDQAVVVYPGQREQQLYAGQIDANAQALGLRVATVSLNDRETWPQLTARVAKLAPSLLLFVGGTAELAVLSQAMAAQRLRCFVLSLSDVDHATLLQMHPGAGVPLILTQVVPNPGSSATPLVMRYRAALKDLFDEPPSPLSLAGFVAGACALEACRRAGPTLDRASLLAEVQRRTPMDIDGFRLDFNAGRRGSSFVTHTLLRADGSLVG